MNYIQYIEESKTWTCPKSGVWKVICVGGGGAGFTYRDNDKNDNSIGTAGGTTSFGSILSAPGGMSGVDINKNKAQFFESNYDIRYTVGINGYNGAGVYGAESGEYIGSGYGASGGAGAPNGSSYSHNSGLPGDVKSVITDISEGTSIACTIGAGGTVTTIGNNPNSIAFPGKSGAIIVQYLGSEM